ncbi:MAG: hypothetical protein KBD07_00260 [Candidatus Omnitrophica bacterium]|jgi:hypothetical protein|nr:hypothetical protein [Candidatus Omnitrophota bacterium]
MSIISEALKKAGSEHQSRPGLNGLAAANQRRKSGSVVTSVIILALLILPFAMPRFLSKNQNGSAPASRTMTAENASSLPLADLPDSGSGTGLAQISVESAGFPVALPITASASSKSPLLQGIVWTENKGYYAILNNDVVKEGSLVGSMRVTKIAANGITLSDGTNTEFIEKSF